MNYLLEWRCTLGSNKPSLDNLEQNHDNLKQLQLAS